MKKIKYFLPSILLMIFIFIMSHTPGDESSLQSSFIQTIIYNIIHINIPMVIIRKAAHMSEYTVLCLTFYYGFYHTDCYKVYLPTVCTFIYACTDEFHQLFIAGRAGCFTDVLIDSCVPILIMILLMYKKRHLHQ